MDNQLDWEEEQQYRKARLKAIRALTYRGRSAAELVGYLVERGYGKGIARRVLEEMIRLKYVDDQKLARELIRGRLRRGYGPHRIRRELMSKGFEPCLVEQLLPELYPREEECRQAAGWLKKKRRQEGEPEGQRQVGRWAAFLRRRGFSEQVILGLLEELN